MDLDGLKDVEGDVAILLLPVLQLAQAVTQTFFRSGYELFDDGRWEKYRPVMPSFPFVNPANRMWQMFKQYGVDQKRWTQAEKEVAANDADMGKEVSKAVITSIQQTLKAIGSEPTVWAIRKQILKIRKRLPAAANATAAASTTAPAHALGGISRLTGTLRVGTLTAGTTTSARAIRTYGSASLILDHTIASWNRAAPSNSNHSEASPKLSLGRAGDKQIPASRL